MTDQSQAGRGNFFQRIVISIRSNSLIYIGIVIFIIALVLFIMWFFNSPVKIVGDEGKDVYEKVLDEAILTNFNDFSSWYKTNIAIQLMLISAALLATITTAITTPDNASWLKKYAVILTAVTTGLAAIHTTFHIRE